jgi:hypothetical protein
MASRIPPHPNPLPHRGRGGLAEWLKRITAMKLCHHDLQIELDDSWWIEGGMVGFVPLTRTYFVDTDTTKGKELLEIKIDEVRPVRRNPGVGIFNDNEEASARERVVSVLRGFRTGSAIPPVEIVLNHLIASFVTGWLRERIGFIVLWPRASRIFQRWKVGNQKIAHLT